MTPNLIGNCHCHGIEVEIPESAIGVVACHCPDCQKLHGNYFAMLVANRAEVRWSGELRPQSYTSSPGIRRSFCPVCGSRIAKDPSDSPKILLSVGLFQPTLARVIIKHVFESSKPDWYELPSPKGITK